MSTHTPGPWTVGSYSTREHVIPEVWGRSFDEISDHIARIEDARLMAAAPELLEALQWLVDILPDPELDNDELQRVWTKKARAAIAKATGEAA